MQKTDLFLFGTPLHVRVTHEAISRVVLLQLFLSFIKDASQEMVEEIRSLDMLDIRFIFHNPGK